jgi:hypothetical protein
MRAGASRIAVRILLAHTLREQAATFYETLGFKRSPTDPLHLYLLLADARKSLGGSPATPRPAPASPR